jgi:hypothetical protein
MSGAASITGLTGATLSAGYLVVSPGKQTLGLTCQNRERNATERTELAIDIAPGQLYRLARREDETCGVVIERPALVQGRIDGPEILILMPGEKKALGQVELAPGRHTLTAICREVTREQVIEQPVELNLELQPGAVYELQVDSKVAQGSCDVRMSSSALP